MFVLVIVLKEFAGVILGAFVGQMFGAIALLGLSLVLFFVISSEFRSLAMSGIKIVTGSMAANILLTVVFEILFFIIGVLSITAEIFSSVAGGDPTGGLLTALSWAIIVWVALKILNMAIQRMTGVQMTGKGSFRNKLEFGAMGAGNPALQRIGLEALSPLAGEFWERNRRRNSGAPMFRFGGAPSDLSRDYLSRQSSGLNGSTPNPDKHSKKKGAFNALLHAPLSSAGKKGAEEAAEGIAKKTALKDGALAAGAAIPGVDLAEGGFLAAYGIGEAAKRARHHMNSGDYAEAGKTLKNHISGLDKGDMASDLLRRSRNVASAAAEHGKGKAGSYATGAFNKSAAWTHDLLFGKPNDADVSQFIPKDGDAHAFDGVNPEGGTVDPKTGQIVTPDGKVTGYVNPQTGENVLADPETKEPFGKFKVGPEESPEDTGRGMPNLADDAGTPEGRQTGRAFTENVAPGSPHVGDRDGHGIPSVADQGALAAVATLTPGLLAAEQEANKREDTENAVNSPYSTKTRDATGQLADREEISSMSGQAETSMTDAVRNALDTSLLSGLVQTSVNTQKGLLDSSSDLNEALKLGSIGGKLDNGTGLLLSPDQLANINSSILEGNRIAENNGANALESSNLSHDVAQQINRAVDLSSFESALKNSPELENAVDQLSRFNISDAQPGSMLNPDSMIGNEGHGVNNHVSEAAVAAAAVAATSALRSDVNDRMDGIDSRIDGVEQNVNAAVDRIGLAESGLTQQSDAIRDNSDRIGAVESGADYTNRKVDATIDELSQQVNRLDSGIDQNSDDVRGANENVERLRGDVNSMQSESADRRAEVDSAISGLTGKYEGLSRNFDFTTNEVNSRFDDLVSDLEEVRNQPSSFDRAIFGQLADMKGDMDAQTRLVQDVMEDTLRTGRENALFNQGMIDQMNNIRTQVNDQSVRQDVDTGYLMDEIESLARNISKQTDIPVRKLMQGASRSSSSQPSGKSGGLLDFFRGMADQYNGNYRQA